MIRERIKYFLLFQILFGASLFGQTELNTVSVQDTIPINFSNKYEISSVSIVPFSEKIFLRGKYLKQNDYNFNYREGYFSLSDTLQYSIFDTLYVAYRKINFSLKKNYKKRSLIVKQDVGMKNPIRVLQTDLSFLSSESIFGKNMQKSGTIARGFSVGTNKDLTVSSGLRLELSGKLAENIELVAALTDENTPIQPEGNTERLEELDKVFIEIRHPNAIGTFGDYDFVESGTEFGNIKRKLQGLKAEGLFESFQGKVAFASSKGQFNSMQFFGEDGNQGPYRLAGKNNERNIIVIAGTERVYIDGEPMTRGENKDYVIEYSNAQITFTSNRLITSASRIIVDFEYTDRKYQRDFFGASSKMQFFGDRLNVRIGLFREGDNQDSPIDILLSDEDKAILGDAGDDILKAVRSGVAEAPIDSTGKPLGAYTKIDTLIDGNAFSYYSYNPGTDSSFYNVVFSYIGEKKGDYVRDAIGQYRFVGKAEGEYLPVRLLPMPSLKQTGNIVINATPFDDLHLNLELAGSMWDKNRFSELDDADNNGYARNIFLEFSPKEMKLFGLNWRGTKIHYKDRYREARFTTLDRVDDVEFNRYYNTENSTGDETLREFGLEISPVKQLRIKGLYGFLKRGELFSSERYLGDVSLREKNSYTVKFNSDFVKSKNVASISDWLKQKGEASHEIWKIRPGVYYEYENKEERANDSDSLLSSSHTYLEAGPFVEVSGLYGFDLRAAFTQRQESFPLAGAMTKESDATTKSLNLKYRGIREFTTDLNVVLRDKRITDEFKAADRSDNETILIRSQSRFNFWSKFIDGALFYEAATEKASKLEKVFIKVPIGTGNYIYAGDLNENGIADEEEFIPTNINGDFILTTLPSDKLYPVITLKFNTRWKINFKKIISSNGFFAKALKTISTETFVRVDEKNNTENTADIYLLRFSKFMNDSTTVRGANKFQQDLFVMKNNPELSFRFRYNQRRSHVNYSSGLEKGYYRERSLRVRMKLVKELRNQTDFANFTENVLAPNTLSSSRTVTRNEITSDFSYRPENTVEVGFKLNVGEITDEFPDEPTNISVNAQSIRITWSISGKGRLRAEAERKELISKGSESFIPFEITQGLSIGKNYIWRVNFDYRFANNLQATVNYDGRKQGDGRVINTMRAEVRAYF